MPRTQKTKTSNAAAKAKAKKGATSGRKPSKKSSADVAEMLKTLNQRTSDASSQQSSSGPVKRTTTTAERKTKPSPGASDSTAGSSKQGQSAVRGRSRKARGVAKRPRPATEDLQEDPGPTTGTKVKRQQKMRGKSQEEIPVARQEGSPTKRRRNTGSRSKLDEEDYLERQVSAQNVAKWQTMGKTSQEFLNQIADGAINVILSEMSGPNYSDIQDHLNNLKARLMKNFVSLKVPNRRQPNYREMEKQARILEAALMETTNQVEYLDKEVQLQEDVLEKKEEELEKLECAEQRDSHDDDADNRKKLHPLLQDSRQDVLGLPPLRRSRRSNASVQFEDVRSSCQQQVVESLRHWSESQGEGSIQLVEFLDAVSALQAALPS